MTPRIYSIDTGTRRQQTPAPLLTTRKGQYPSLPSQLAARATPSSTTPLLHISLSDWHLLNAHTRLTTTALLAGLGTLPSGAPSLKSLIANHDAITILTPRPSSSTACLTNSPGKSVSLTLTSSQSITPAEVHALHEALCTDLVAAPTDHAFLHLRDTPTQRRRRTTRADTLQNAFLSCEPRDALLSIDGGMDIDSRVERASYAAHLAGTHRNVKGFCIDGLYAGESPEARDEMIRTTIDTLPSDGLRILTAGSGAPWEVLSAVRFGVDIIGADFPFEMAACGRATDLRNAAGVNVRDRRYLIDKGTLVDGCQCFVCQEGFSRAYFRHLFEVHEMVAVSLLAAHNLWDYFTWFERLREAIAHGQHAFKAFCDGFEELRDRARLDNAGGDKT